MNKSQSLALVAIGVIAVLLVTAAVADPQDAMAGKKHKRHHHNNGGAAGSSSAAGDSAAAAAASGGSATASHISRWCNRSRPQQQAIRIEKITDRTSQNISFFLCF